jgi:eukaryotic-like serine/threonine-protein kinase
VPPAPSQWPPDPRLGGAGPSAQQNWPSDPTAALAPANRVGEPYRPASAYQGQPPRPGGQPPVPGGRPPRRTGRVVLILLIILIVALVLGALAYHLASGSSTAAPPATSPSQSVSQPVSLTPSTSASQSAAASSAPAVAETPSQVVQAYYQAINEHRYQVAWQLGGKNTGQSYASYVAGFNGTASDVLLIGEASGDIVRGTLTANQTDGSIKTYSGSYTVQDGVIATFQVAQIAN